MIDSIVIINNLTLISSVVSSDSSLTAIQTVFISAKVDQDSFSREKL